MLVNLPHWAFKTWVIPPKKKNIYFTKCWVMLWITTSGCDPLHYHQPQERITSHYCKMKGSTLCTTKQWCKYQWGDGQRILIFVFGHFTRFIILIFCIDSCLYFSLIFNTRQVIKQYSVIWCTKLQMLLYIRLHSRRPIISVSEHHSGGKKTEKYAVN